MIKKLVSPIHCPENTKWFDYGCRGIETINFPDPNKFFHQYNFNFNLLDCTKMSMHPGDLYLVKEKSTGNLYELLILEDFIQQIRIRVDNGEEEWIETDHFHYQYSIEQFLRNIYTAEENGNTGNQHSDQELE